MVLFYYWTNMLRLVIFRKKATIRQTQQLFAMIFTVCKDTVLVNILMLMLIVCSASEKLTYLIGGYAPNGPSVFYQSFNATFSTYLTAAIRQNPKYPSISFKTVPVDFQSTYALADAGKLDFVFTQPSLFSCSVSCRY